MKRLHLVEMYADGTGMTHSTGCLVDGDPDPFVKDSMKREPDGNEPHWLWATGKFDGSRYPPGAQVPRRALS